MKKWIYFLIAIVFYTITHEFFHGLMSVIFDEYEKLKIHWYGPEVMYITPVEERISGIKWFFISGLGNFITLAIGYLIFSQKNKIINHFQEDTLVMNLLYYLAVVFLLFDAINLSIGPLIYGGDALGISVGLNIELWIIQVFFGIVLLANRELVARLMENFGVRTSNILFKSWLHK